MRFRLQNLVSKSFLVLLWYSLLYFIFISACSIASASNIPKYSQFSFSPCIFPPQSFFWVLVIFSMIFIHWPFLSVSIVYTKLFCCLCIWLWVCSYTFFTDLLVDFSFVILEYPVSVSFESPFFRQFLFFFFLQIEFSDLSGVLFCFSSHHIFACSYFFATFTIYNFYLAF